MPATKKLVIVESPAKAKTIAQYLGDGYEVQASVGHIRDLIEPKNLPPELKKGPLGKFSIDVENGFAPYYVVSDEKKRTVTDLKKALKEADELYLATDEDREGEAIAWHLLEVLKPKVPVKRMVFHEITKDAIQAAQENTRELDTALVDAQETRRILDRLYGYEVSPVLWRKIGPGLSAGRVQSAATRLVVDRERERLAFVTASYWDLDVELATSAEEKAPHFAARLARLDGKRIATGRDFTDAGALKGEAVALDEAAASALAAGIRDDRAKLTVAKLETKPYTRRPAAPFTTSTLQQEAARKLRFTARQTMSTAQSLYENGFITYMRTDSPGLSKQAIDAARAQATKLYGADTIPEKPRVYSGKSKNAQEAHEAIRPSGDTFRTPDSLTGTLRGNELKLYDLIWKRTVASQMADARGSTATVTIEAVTPENGTAELTASGTVITFRGFLAAYEESRDDDRDAPAEPNESRLPELSEGQALHAQEVEAKGHETSPPPRYTEASLVKTLEELGIGRPSTYAAIISTIVDRGYVTPRGTALVPNWIAFSVVRLLEDHFSELVQYDFTAAMEGDLDRIAGGEQDRTDWLNGFYFGNDAHQGLRGVVDNLGEIDARDINSVRITDDITLRIGKYGPYLEVPEAGSETPRRVNIPEELAPDELTPAKARELVDAPVVGDRVLGTDPANGKQIVVKDGRFGPYVTELDPEPEPEVDSATGEVTEAEKPKPKRGAKKDAAPKPRTASLFKSMDPATIDFETALKLLTLPRVVGKDPADDAEITAQNGRYGAYLKKGTETRSLESEDQIFAIDLTSALELLAQPKYGNRRASSALKEFDADPVSGKPIKIKDGRFGPYVTDGETNATIPRGEEVDDVDFERAVQLIADKRAKGPAKKKAPAKRAPAKRTTAAKKK
ncbi:type I DNA topoisomerase [Schumannella sp. 10F1B-5-1]|uniref:type I DNA topoisomerase n=1 Tax=Schumannella sp. 10F1B-5-1 TaxID=2590780 RepID=UPI0011300640|nr:type I DNA topoisomerase [Schumannella sp. 10F1B-5-1]TPW73477.1 type I DNA topoisomerase [Schumannella sp. 10F1B-5-1]